MILVGNHSSAGGRTLGAGLSEMFPSQGCFELFPSQGRVLTAPSKPALGAAGCCAAAHRAELRGKYPRVSPQGYRAGSYFN